MSLLNEQNDTILALFLLFNFLNKKKLKKTVIKKKKKKKNQSWRKENSYLTFSCKNNQNPYHILKKERDWVVLMRTHE